MIMISAILDTPVEGTNKRRLLAPVEFHLGGYLLFTVPEGFEYDGLTLPKFARKKWDRWGAKYKGPALLHDYCLKTKGIWKWEMDWLFYAALRSQAVSALEATIFWMAVRTQSPGKLRGKKKA